MNTGDEGVDKKSWIVKAVIVNIDFTSDFLMGLRDIRRIKLFRYIPELVEDFKSDIDDMKSLHETEQGFPTQPIRAMEPWNGQMMRGINGQWKPTEKRK